MTYSILSPFTLLPYISEDYRIQIAVVTAIICAAVYILVRKLVDEQPSLPGPWGFPILGYLPCLGKEPNVTFMKLREKFGDIFQVRMGSWTAVIVNGNRAIKEALQDRGDDFSGRPQFVSSKLLHNGESLSLGQFNDKWKMYHKLAAKIISKFSSAAKNPIEDMVHEELDILVNCFMSHVGKSFDPQKYIILSVSSIIYQICYGREQNIRESNDYKIYQRNAAEFDKFVTAGNIVDAIPWLQYVMPWKLHKFTQLIEISNAFRRKKIAAHKETFSPDHLCDLTDGLLAASKEETRFTEESLMGIIDAVFGAGSHTLSSKLRWTVLLMAAHPNVQKRVQAEIDDIVGDGRRPGIQDRAQLIYTEAVLHEINRYVALEPLALPHSTTKDTELGGYRIKKDTLVFFNLYSMSHDKAVWGDPGVFRPERFLDDDGQIKECMMKEFLPFSSGRRRCLGEQLARTELFLFLSGLLQKCSILKPPEISDYRLDYKVALTRDCLPYTIQVQPRNTVDNCNKLLVT